MAFIIGYLIGSVVTLFLVYRMLKKKKEEALKKISTAQSLNNNSKNFKEGDDF